MKQASRPRGADLEQGERHDIRCHQPARLHGRHGGRRGGAQRHGRRRRPRADAARLRGVQSGAAERRLPVRVQKGACARASGQDQGAASGQAGRHRPRADRHGRACGRHRAGYLDRPSRPIRRQAAQARNHIREGRQHDAVARLRARRVRGVVSLRAAARIHAPTRSRRRRPPPTSFWPGRKPTPNVCSTPAPQIPAPAARS